MNLMNCRGGRRRRLDLDYAKSFASSKMPTSILRPVRRKSPRIRRVSGFDPHRPYQHLLCEWKLDSSRSAQIFAAWLRPLFRKDWVVYSKPPFGGPDYVLQRQCSQREREALSIANSVCRKHFPKEIRHPHFHRRNYISAAAHYMVILGPRRGSLRPWGPSRFSSRTNRRAWPSYRLRSAQIRGAQSRWAVCGCASNRAS